MDVPPTIRASLERHHQAHVLTFWDQLTQTQRASLLEQVDEIDFEALDDLIERYVQQRPKSDLPTDLSPAPYYRSAWGPSPGYDVTKYRGLGEALIRGGKIAAFTVAGGQGTRLGWDGPKGTFPATVVTGKPLFRVFAEQILATQRKYGVVVPWYIMTSPLNDAATRAFFADNNYFGLTRRNVFMFPQGVLPSMEDKTGRLLLSAKHEIAMNPDGHGGSIKALAESGAVDDLMARGIEHLSYHQVDNPLVKVIDPVFIGLHAAAPDSSGEMSSKMVPKSGPDEKVGVFCRTDGKVAVIEYSDLSQALANERDEGGNLRFNAGSIAIHILGVKFIQRLTADRHHFALRYHRADKKVPHVDLKTGARIEPKEPNGVKLEAFVFDAIPLAESSIVLETSRVEEFAPIKNATGIDSPATSHQLQSDRNARWLSRCGVQVPMAPRSESGSNGHVQAKIEISPLTALEPEDLANQALPPSIAPRQEIVL